MKPNATSQNAATDLTDWARIDAMTDADIDLSEHSEWTEEQFTQARRRGPQKTPLKQPVSLRLAPDLVAFFKDSGAGWQTRLEAVLRQYVEQQRSAP